MAFGATAVLAALALGACDLGDGGDEPAGSAGIDSAERFSGHEHDVAEAIEGFEAAIRADDAGRLCRRVLIPRSRPSWGGRSCAEDPDNRASAELRGAEPGAYDLIVRRIVSHRLGNGPIPLSHRANLARAKKRISRRDRQAGAVVAVRRGTRRSVEMFTLLRVEGKWRVRARAAVHPIAAGDAHRRAEAIPPLGRYLRELRVYAAAVPSCRSHAFVTHGIVGPDSAPTSRQALLRSTPYGRPMRRGLKRGGFLELIAIDYSEPARTWSYRKPSGRTVTYFPVHGAGPRYLLAEVGGCRVSVGRGTRAITGRDLGRR
jgi:hypothetical protein